MFIEVQTQRRSARSCRAKARLRESQIDIPVRIRAGYWLVYSIDTDVKVYYDADKDAYTVETPNREPVTIRGGPDLVEVVEESGV